MPDYRQDPWRPEGWVSPEDMPGDGPLDGLDGCGMYEAGADALLEKLKGEGVHTDASRVCEGFECAPELECSDCPFRKNGPGWLVWIPEE